MMPTVLLPAVFTGATTVFAIVTGMGHSIGYGLGRFRDRDSGPAPSSEAEQPASGFLPASSILPANTSV